MKSCALFGALAIVLTPGFALANLVDYEDLSEGFLGATFTHQGVTYRDVNNVTGFYADGVPFVAGEPGTDSIIENATLFYNDFPTYGSPINAMTFGNAFVNGENLSIGALASVFMDFETLANSASFDIAYYENGPWGTIEYKLDALLNGQVVASDNFFIADGGGRDNVAFTTMSVSGANFDSLHLYAMKNGSYTVPRGMIDNLNYAPVPEPATLAALGLGAAALAARRRRK
jgi:hypothetical protein